MKMNESDLFSPLKEYLEHQGYSVHSEVKNCDIVARKGEELTILELKKSISLKLVVQAVKRKEITESVYIAVPLIKGKGYPPNYSGLKLLLRRLEVGLIFVRFLPTKTKIEIAFHPVPFSERNAKNKRRSIIREIDGRYAEFNKAGEPSTDDKIYAYKQESLLIASFLLRDGALSPKRLRELGSSENTQAILSKNVYGWYEKIERGIYKLHSAGKKALKRYADVLNEINKNREID